MRSEIESSRERPGRRWPVGVCGPGAAVQDVSSDTSVSEAARQLLFRGGGGATSPPLACLGPSVAERG